MGKFMVHVFVYQGKSGRQPEAAARALLTLIAADPQFVMRTLAKSA
jgi:hypothetical protein